jgi:hypothetical protein
MIRILTAKNNYACFSQHRKNKVIFAQDYNLNLTQIGAIKIRPGAAFNHFLAQQNYRRNNKVALNGSVYIFIIHVKYAIVLLIKSTILIPIHRHGPVFANLSIQALAKKEASIFA